MTDSNTNVQKLIDSIEKSLEPRILIASHPLGDSNVHKKFLYEPLNNRFIIFDGKEEKFYLRNRYTWTEMAEKYIIIK